MIENCLFDVIIPCGPNDVKFVIKVVSELRKFIINADKIYVITNEKFVNKITKNINDSRTIVLNEDTLVHGLNFSIVRSLMNDKNRHEGYGWIFQQLLKLGFATTEYAKDYYLSWDADTLPLHELVFFENGHPIFTKKTEYHKPYFETNERLIGIGKVKPYSFIAEHMVFKTKYVNDMIAEIMQSKTEGKSWVEKCINSCDFIMTEVFSEFELYGSYVSVKHPDEYKTRQLRSFRNGGLIRGRYINDRLLSALSFDLDIASFEYKAESPFPYNLDGWFWRKFRRYEKWKNIPLCEIPNELYCSIKRRIFGK